MKYNSVSEKAVKFVEFTDELGTIVKEHTLLSSLVYATLLTFISFPLGDIGVIIILLGIMAPFVVMTLHLIFKSKMNKEEKDIATKIQFYQECEKQGITDLNDPLSKEKATLIAQRSGCRFQNIEDYYSQAKDILLSETQRKQEEEAAAEYQKLQDAELDQHRILSQFADFIGRNKRVAILEHQQWEYLQRANELDENMKHLYYAAKDREINSGIAGGIASGLFGGVAGVAAYVDAENQNAQIRSQNQRNLDALAPITLRMADNANQLRNEANRLQALIDEAKIKLVSYDTDETVFSYLSVSAEKVEISQTGAFTITANIQVNADNQLLCVGKNEGVIDGTIEAEMHQNGACVGSALLVLPAFGVNDQETIEGIAIANANVSLPYEIKFKPYHLWVMEK